MTIDEKKDFAFLILIGAFTMTFAFLIDDGALGWAFGWMGLQLYYTIFPNK